MRCSKLSFILGKVAISTWNLLRVASTKCPHWGKLFERVSTGGLSMGLLHPASAFTYAYIIANWPHESRIEMICYII